MSEPDNVFRHEHCVLHSPHEISHKHTCMGAPDDIPGYTEVSKRTHLRRDVGELQHALDGHHLLLRLRRRREQPVEQPRDRQRIAQAQPHQPSPGAPAHRQHTAGDLFLHSTGFETPRRSPPRTNSRSVSAAYVSTPLSSPVNGGGQQKLGPIIPRPSTHSELFATSQTSQAYILPSNRASPFAER